MTEPHVSTPASELMRTESGSDLVAFIGRSQAMTVPDECIPGIINAWRALAEHWRNLGETEAA